MAYYHPCRGCIVDKESCKRRRDIRSAIGGLSVTSIKFKCTDRVPEFRVGQRVSFDWTLYDDGHEDDVSLGEELISFNATIVCEASKSTRFTVRVDDGVSEFGYDPKEVFRNGGRVVNVRSIDIKPLDEPDRVICKSCLAYAGEDVGCHSFVGDRFDTYIADGCLKHE